MSGIGFLVMRGFGYCLLEPETFFSSFVEVGFTRFRRFTGEE